MKRGRETVQRFFRRFRRRPFGTDTNAEAPVRRPPGGYNRRRSCGAACRRYPPSPTPPVTSVLQLLVVEIVVGTVIMTKFNFFEVIFVYRVY